MRRTRVEQPVQRERVDPGVDLADRPLRRRRVPLLDNPCNRLAVRGRCGRSREGLDDRGDDRRGRAGGDVSSTSVFKVFSRQERHVARQQDQRAALPARHRFGRQQGMGRAELWLLHHKREAGTRPPAPSRQRSA